VSLECIEISIQVKDLYTASNGDGTNEAVDKFAHGLPFSAAYSVKGSCCVIVDRFSWNNRVARQESAKLMQMLLAASARQHFHPERLADRDFSVEELVNSIAGRRTSIPRKLNPS